MASRCVKESFPYLIVLYQYSENKNLRKLLCKNPKILKSLAEISLNIVKGNIGSSKNIAQHKRDLLKLTDKRLSLEEKYRLVTRGQKGESLLSFLLGVGIPALISLWRK